MPLKPCKASKWVVSGLKPLSGYPEPANVAQFIYALIVRRTRNFLRRTLVECVHHGSLACGNERAPSPRNEVR